MNTKEIKPFNTYYDFIEERNMWLCNIGKGGILIVCREVGETKSLAFQSALKSFLILKKENPSIIENILNGYNKLKRNHKGLNKEINPDLINKKPMKTLLTTILLLICLCSVGQNDTSVNNQYYNYFKGRNIEFEYDKVNKYIFLDIELGELDNNNLIKTLIDYWKEYKQACYKDSTAIYYWTICDWDCIDIPCEKGDKDFFGNECPEYWIHKDPNNFLEFMEYLETKIK